MLNPSARSQITGGWPWHATASTAIPAARRGSVSGAGKGYLDERPNVDMAERVYRLALEEGVRRVIVASSNHAADWYEHVIHDRKVEVVTPDDYMGDCIGDLNSRRGQILGMDARGNAQVINAMVPLANMFGYVNQLRSMTQGRAAYTMTFDHYAPVPQAVADEVVAKLAG